mmetsp:Transcript_54461/g.127173  ORF Transcript_54461/g.127173 Transcript_54461/m.127173 type:complete len:208 (-) Transcript_54461:18-641(-)
MILVTTAIGSFHVSKLKTLILWKPIKYATKDTTKAANNKKTKQYKASIAPVSSVHIRLNSSSFSLVSGDNEATFSLMAASCSAFIYRGLCLELSADGAPVAAIGVAESATTALGFGSLIEAASVDPFSAELFTSESEPTAPEGSTASASCKSAGSSSSEPSSATGGGTLPALVVMNTPAAATPKLAAMHGSAASLASNDAAAAPMLN